MYQIAFKMLVASAILPKVLLVAIGLTAGLYFLKVQSEAVIAYLIGIKALRFKMASFRRWLR